MHKILTEKVCDGNTIPYSNELSNIDKEIVKNQICFRVCELLTLVILKTFRFGLDLDSNVRCELNEM